MEDDRSQMQVLNLLTLESEPLGRFLGDQTLSEPTERGIALVLQDRGVAQPFVGVVEAPPCVVWLDLAAASTAPASPHTSSSSSSSSSRESSSDTDSTSTSATDTVLLVHRKNAVATAHRMLEHALQQLASRLRAHEALPDTSSSTSTSTSSSSSSDSDGWGGGRERTPLSQQLADAEAAVARTRTQLEHDFTLSLPGGAGAGRRLLARAEDAWRATLRGLAGLLARAHAAQARRDDVPSPSPTLALASASAVAAAPSELLASALAPFPHVSAAEADALAQENARLRADLARATAERDETRDECRRLQRALVEVQQQQQQRQREQQQQREQREQQQQQQRKREWGARARTDEVSVDRTYLEFMGSCCIVFDAVLVRGQRVFRAHGVAVPTFLERDQAHAIDPAYRGAILCRALRATSRIHVESDVCAPHAFGFCDEENDMLLLLLLDRRTASSTGCTAETRTRSSLASTSGR